MVSMSSRLMVLVVFSNRGLAEMKTTRSFVEKSADAFLKVCCKNVAFVRTRVQYLRIFKTRQKLYFCNCTDLPQYTVLSNLKQDPST